MDARNREGYPDPAAAQAVRNVSAFGYRPLVYICSPFTGDTEGNIRRARDYSRYAVDAGTIPIAPHLLLPQYMKEETERELAMRMDLVILDRCEELWVFGDEISAGMKTEIRRAEKRGMPVRYFTGERRGSR